MATDTAVLRLIQVQKRFAPIGGNPVNVLSGVDLELHAGESVAIVGPSGSGKSTLLNIIGTLEQPDAGQVVLHGRDVASLSPSQTAEVRSREIGFVFQSHHLLPQCTLLENVLLPTLPVASEVLRDGAPERAKHLLRRVGLSERLHHRPSQLSGGECQRVALVRALINEPRLVLADEPTGALDGASARNLADLLLELNQELGVAMVVVTHSLELAGRLQRACELRAGKLEPVKL